MSIPESFLVVRVLNWCRDASAFRFGGVQTPASPENQVDIGPGFVCNIYICVRVCARVCVCVCGQLVMISMHCRKEKRRESRQSIGRGSGGVWGAHQVDLDRAAHEVDHWDKRVFDTLGVEVTMLRTTMAMIMTA